MATKGLTASEIDKLPLTPEDRERLKVHYGVGYTPAKTMASANALAAAGQPQVEDLGGDDRATTAETKAADAAAAAKAAGYAPAPAYKIIQPAGYSVPVATGYGVTKIQQPEAVAVQADGPALSVDSFTPGALTVPKSSFTGSPDYGSAAVPYEVGELGGMGMSEPDKIVVKKPKGSYEFAPDTIVAKPPTTYELPAKYAKKGK